MLLSLITGEANDDKSTDKLKKKRTKNPPEQKLGDTPVPPWEMPTPKEEARPVKRALKKAVSSINSQEKADEVIEKLETAAAGKNHGRRAKIPSASAHSGQSRAKGSKRQPSSASDTEQAKKVIETTARVIAAADKRPKETVSEAVQEVISPGTTGRGAYGENGA